MNTFQIFRAWIEVIYVKNEKKRNINRSLRHTTSDVWTCRLASVYLYIPRPVRKIWLKKTEHFWPYSTHFDFYNVTLSFKSEDAPINEEPSFIYKKRSDIIAPVRSSLFNEVVASGSYPNLLKVASVILIHKPGFKFDFKNYSSISVLSFLNKVFERALHYRILKKLSQVKCNLRRTIWLPKK